MHNNEIIEEEFYKIWRNDRSKKDKKKYNKIGGGGVFILAKQGLDIETKEVTVKTLMEYQCYLLKLSFMTHPNYVSVHFTDMTTPKKKCWNLSKIIIERYLKGIVKLL